VKQLCPHATSIRRSQAADLQLELYGGCLTEFVSPKAVTSYLLVGEFLHPSPSQA
jgi:hypothetical protein